MLIRLLVLQRKEKYGGQLGPEVLAVVDETTMDDNPSWWPEEIERQKHAVGTDAESWAEIEVDLPDQAIKRALTPPIERVTLREIRD